MRDKPVEVRDIRDEDPSDGEDLLAALHELKRLEAKSRGEYAGCPPDAVDEVDRQVRRVWNLALAEKRRTARARLAAGST